MNLWDKLKSTVTGQITPKVAFDVLLAIRKNDLSKNDQDSLLEAIQTGDPLWDLITYEPSPDLEDLPNSEQKNAIKTLYPLLPSDMIDQWFDSFKNIPLHQLRNILRPYLYDVWMRKDPDMMQRLHTIAGERGIYGDLRSLYSEDVGYNPRKDTRPIDDLKIHRTPIEVFFDVPHDFFEGTIEQREQAEQARIFAKPIGSAKRAKNVSEKSSKVIRAPSSKTWSVANTIRIQKPKTLADLEVSAQSPKITPKPPSFAKSDLEDLSKALLTKLSIQSNPPRSRVKVLTKPSVLQKQEKKTTKFIEKSTRQSRLFKLETASQLEKKQAIRDFIGFFEHRLAGVIGYLGDNKDILRKAVTNALMNYDAIWKSSLQRVLPTHNALFLFPFKNTKNYWMYLMSRNLNVLGWRNISWEIHNLENVFERWYTFINKIPCEYLLFFVFETKYWKTLAPQYVASREIAQNLCQKGREYTEKVMTGKSKEKQSVITTPVDVTMEIEERLGSQRKKEITKSLQNPLCCPLLFVK